MTAATATRKMMIENDSMKGCNGDTCPNHGAEEVKEYTFGKFDAVVIKWACGCCASYVGDSLDDDGAYHTSYPNAAGRAKMFAAIRAAKHRD